jgi:3-deoxy-manno-octulosonate cytidylyltransferase (CMP-KDO synthetase)
MMEKASDITFAGIIPARFASTRFPGKPLAMIGDKPMVQRVYEQAMQSLGIVYVATDDKRISEAILKFGGRSVMTSEKHQSGTDRCAEAADKIMTETGMKIDVVINIQGDEPFIKPEQINLLKKCFSDPDVEIATLIRKTIPEEDIFNPNHPKVILDSRKNAIYFSRSAIPFIRDTEPSEWSVKHQFFKHIGLYAYKTGTLQKITRLPESILEVTESLEQNRWIENGYKIRCALTDMDSYGIDTPDDLDNARLIMKRFK